MNRWYGSLPAPEIATHLTERSVLCLPIGSYEQHGPHLPLHTDTVIATQFTNRLIDRYGNQHDLWALPALPYGCPWSIRGRSARSPSGSPRLPPCSMPSSVSSRAPPRPVGCSSSTAMAATAASSR
ncbi:creatininase family protein [Salinispora arenicola]|nr:creatininase family protein [Salinispora arenicola]